MRQRIVRVKAQGPVLSEFQDISEIFIALSWPNERH